MITGNVFVLLILAGNCVNIIIYEQKGVRVLFINEIALICLILTWKLKIKFSMH